MKKDIENREDIYLLVSSFYKKIRRDKVLAPFFNDVIKDWDSHIINLTNFWESNLFLKSKYLGNPIEAHIKADTSQNGQITQEHFGLWMNLWFETIDELFQGDYANNAKQRARKMSTFLYLKLFEARQS